MGPTQLGAQILGTVRVIRDSEQSSLMSTLRDARTKMALLVAAADITDAWSLDEVTRALE